MAALGIDMGAKNVKALLLERGEVLGHALEPGGLRGRQAAARARARALQVAGLAPDSALVVVSTGSGRAEVHDARRQVTDVTCAARGALQMVPAARTVIDVGAEEARAMRCDGRGRVLDFAVNEKCAAGVGAFTEALARALELPLEQLGPLSCTSQRLVPMNAQCVVFAESEMVSMIHDNVPKADIARAVHEAMASRTLSMVRRVGLEPPVVLVGGVALNRGFVEALGRALGETPLQVPEQPQLAAALGAALIAEEL